MAKKSFARDSSSVDRLKSIKDDNAVFSDSTKIHHLLIEKIKPNPHQPRVEITLNSLNELKQSINQSGLLQPIVVSKNNDGTFTVVAGHRRLEAHKHLQKETIEAIITTKSEEELKLLVLLENIQRKDLDPLELALCYTKLMKDLSYSQEELAAYIYKSQSHVSRTINLLNLSTPIQEEIKNKTYTNIKVLNALNKVALSDQKDILDQVRDLETEEAIKKIKELTMTEKVFEPFEFKANKDEDKFVIKIDLKILDEQSKEEVIQKLEELTEKIKGF